MNYILAMLFFILFHLSGFSQDCCINYITKRYSIFQSHTYIYSTGAEGYNGQITDLEMTVYVPDESTCDNRPVLLLMHGGGFISGNRYNVLDVCMDFASRGWVTATIEYRLGWLGTPECPADEAETIRAWYRAILDLRASIDFLSTHPDMLGIDAEQIYIGGWSAGAYATLGAAFLAGEEERPAVCLALGDVEMGGIFYARPELPAIYAPAPIRGVLSLAGACFFPEHINEEGPAILMINNGADDAGIPLADCSTWWNVPCEENAPSACGQSLLIPYFQSSETDFLLHTFTETNCSHLLANQCFPGFDEEMDMAANFFYERMPYCEYECPVQITGMGEACRGEPVSYMCECLDGANYYWEIEGSGYILSGEGSCHITVYWYNGTAGRVSVVRTIE